MRVPCKKVILFGILLLFLISGYFSYRYLRVKFAKVLVTLVENREIAFHDKKKISDFIVNINGTLLDDAVIPTTTLGKQDVTFTYMNDDHIKVTYTYQVEVVDQVTPVIWLGPTYRIPKVPMMILQVVLCVVIIMMQSQPVILREIMILIKWGLTL